MDLVRTSRNHNRRRLYICGYDSFMATPRGFRVGSHVVHNLHAHIVFAPKSRRPVITPRVFDTMRVAWRQVCGGLGATLVESDYEGDHVHLLIAYPPKVRLSTLVQRLKGHSARRVRQFRFPEVRRYLWGAAFWSSSYCVVSCGGAPLDVIAAYVRGQTGAPSVPVGGASPPD